MMRLLFAAPILLVFLVPSAVAALGLFSLGERSGSSAVVTAEPVPFDELPTGTVVDAVEPAG